MYILIIIFPLICILISSTLGYFLRKDYLILLNVVGIYLSLLISFYAYIEVIMFGSQFHSYIVRWFEIGIVKVNFSFFFNYLSITMLIIIFFISFSVHLFSIDYMSGDKHFVRFINYIGLFTIFMALMVISNNIVQLFIGWEGIGLLSYLLINFWYTRPEANRSSMKAIIINKFGDAGLYLFIIFIFLFYKSCDTDVINLLILLDYEPIYIHIFNIFISKADILTLLLMIAAVGKSAQIGLHAWLPDAMEGPTPVSALLHSATMVTAGIFLIIKFSPIIESSLYIVKFISIIALLTNIFASFSAIGQYDIKKIIAYSTTGQLAYMLASCGFSQYSLALQHLFDHAFLKAALFIGAGAIIYISGGIQDIRLLGGLSRKVPLIFITFMFAIFSLLAIPFTSGFYSKESIIESILLSTNVDNLIFSLCIISISLSAYYSINLVYCIFYGKDVHIHNLNILPLLTQISLVLLMLASISVGYMFTNLYTSNGINFINDAWYMQITTNNFGEPFDDIIFYIIVELPLIFTLFGIFITILINNYILINKFYLKFINILNRKFYYDLFIWLIFILFSTRFIYIIFFKSLDRGIIELFGPHYFHRNLFENLFIFKNLDNTRIPMFIYLILLYIVFIFLIVLLPLLLFTFSSLFLSNTISFYIFSIFFIFVFKSKKIINY